MSAGGRVRGPGALAAPPPRPPPRAPHRQAQAQRRAQHPVHVEPGTEQPHAPGLVAAAECLQALEDLQGQGAGSAAAGGGTIGETETAAETETEQGRHGTQREGTDRQCL